MNVPPAFKLSAFGLTGILVLLTFSKHPLPKVQAHEAGEGCSVATLNGAYGLVLKGEVLSVGPIVAVGVSTFDGKGHFVADQTINLNGNVVQAPLTGTYSESQLHRHRGRCWDRPPLVRNYCRRKGNGPDRQQYLRSAHDSLRQDRIGKQRSPRRLSAAAIFVGLQD